MGHRRQRRQRLSCDDLTAAVSVGGRACLLSFKCMAAAARRSSRNQGQDTAPRSTQLQAVSMHGTWRAPAAAPPTVCQHAQRLANAAVRTPAKSYGRARNAVPTDRPMSCRPRLPSELSSQPAALLPLARWPRCAEHLRKLPPGAKPANVSRSALPPAVPLPWRHPRSPSGV